MEIVIKLEEFFRTNNIKLEQDLFLVHDEEQGTNHLFAYEDNAEAKAAELSEANIYSSVESLAREVLNHALDQKHPVIIRNGTRGQSRRMTWSSVHHRIRRDVWKWKPGNRLVGALYITKKEANIICELRGRYGVYEREILKPVFSEFLSENQDLVDEFARSFCIKEYASRYDELEHDNVKVEIIDADPSIIIPYASSDGE